MVTTVAPTIPVEAASMVATRTVDKPNPPRILPNSTPIVVSNSSAILDRSSVTPISTNSGTAIRMSLVMMPQ